MTAFRDLGVTATAAKTVIEPVERGYHLRAIMVRQRLAPRPPSMIFA